MSWEFNVLKTNLDSFDKASFEDFSKTKGYIVLMYPGINLKEDSGFLPFKIEGSFLSGLDGKNFITGFELYSDLSETNAIAEPPSKGLLGGLFGKKPLPVVPDPNGDMFDLLFVCSGSDLLEIFMAHLFGLFFAKTQGSECIDPQEGIEYKNPDQLEKTIDDIVVEMKDRSSKGTLILHPFENWS
jgi:hypothetical protein